MMATMMRNFVLIGAILLVSASASVCEFWKSKNPVSVLNEYLVDNFKSNDLAEIINELNNWLKDVKKDSEAVELAGLIVKLHPTDLCSVTNLTALRAMVKAVLGYDKKTFMEPKVGRRLNKVLANYLLEVWHKCSRLYKKKLEEMRPRLKRELEYPIWIYVDNLSFDHALPSPKDSIDLESFSGAKRLSQGKWKPSGYDLKNTLKKVHSRITDETSWVKTSERTGKKERLTFEDAKRYVSECLLRPCELLLNDAELKTITEPMTVLGEAMVLKPETIDRHYVVPLEWASRSFFCKWATDTGVDKLAKTII